jgi:hypothetical protein
MRLKRMKLSGSSFLLVVLSLSPFSTAQEIKIERPRLPPLVEKTVASLPKNATVRGFSREIEHGVTYYEAKLTVAGRHKDLLMDKMGNVVEVEDEVTMDSLPPSVQDGLEAVTRDAKVLSVESISRRGKVVFYEADVLKDGRRSQVQVGPDGEPLKQDK